ncbi:MAG: Calx-beta domain-containing protein, partial [Actinomycetota bacterium]
GEGAFAGSPDWGQRAGGTGCDDPPLDHGGTNQDPATAEGGAFRSQDLRTGSDPAGLSGTVIRIDKDTGLAHPDNPNADHPDPNVARIVAYGLRNPYRTAIRPGTDELWVGDVGWNDWEEINVVDAPDDEVSNFGWPCFEGPDVGYDVGAELCADLEADGPTARTEPYWAYRQRESFADDPGCLNNNGSPSALTFYEGGFYPEEHDGAFFLGDYSRRCVWEMFPGPDGRPDPSTAQLILTDIAVSDLEIGPSGDVYMLNIFGGGPLGGTVVRLSYPGGQAEPIARVVASATEGPAPFTTTLDASASTPGVPGDELSFAWDLDGDGQFDDGDTAVIEPTFTEEGRRIVQVRVSDTSGSAIASKLLIVGTPPTVTISHPVLNDTWQVGDEVPYAGSAVDSNGQPVPPESFVWDLILHHCESLDDCHTHNIGTVEGVADGVFLAPEHEYPSFIEIQLSATDSIGLTGTSTIELFPDTTFVTVDSSPQGLDAGFNGKPVTTPSTHEVIVGTGNTLTAPPIQSADGSTFVFDAWSDGGARVHDVVVTEPVTVTAEYDTFDVPTIIPGDVTVVESTGGRNRVEVPLTLTEAHTRRVTVRATLAAGTATLGSDVKRWPTRTVVFNAGVTERTIAVDIVVESTGGRNRVEVPLTLTEAHTRRVTVRATLAAGTATLGSDVKRWPTRTVVFNAGVTERTIAVDIVGDDVHESDEEFSIVYSRPSNAPLADETSTISIRDDDPMPTVEITDQRLSEGSGGGTKNASVRVRLSGRTDQPVSVVLATADGSAVADEDYVPIASEIVRFSPRATTRTTSVRVVRDDLAETDEYFELDVLSVDNAFAPEYPARLTIDDDEPVISVGDAVVTEGVRGRRSMRFTVRADRRPRAPITMAYATEDDTAAAGVDYEASTGTLVLATGKRSATITVPVLGDAVPELDETFRLLLAEVEGATLGDGEAIGTIRSDDYVPIVSIGDVERAENGRT